MFAFTIKKTIRALFTIFFIISVVFILSRITGDPTLYLLPDDASEAMREEMRENLGLNLPVQVQYKNYLTELFKGDAGDSFEYDKPVTSLFAEALPKTLQLGISSLIISSVIGIILGVLSAVYNGSVIDKITMGASILGHTMPAFVLAILLILFFSLRLRLLPSGGYGSAKQIIMPLMVSCFGPISKISRLTRSSMMDILHSDFLRALRAKGVPRKTIILRHALKNSLIPVITIVGLEIGGLLGGSPIIETVFAWPGLGWLLTNAAKKRDFPVLQYGILLTSVVVTLTNTLVDLSYAYLDPRIRSNK